MQRPLGTIFRFSSVIVAPWLFGGVAVVALLTSLLTLRRYLRV